MARPKKRRRLERLLGRRLGLRRRERRAVISAGGLHIVRRGLPNQVAGDRYHYLVTSSWPLVIAVAAWTFFLINLIFATIYWTIGGIDNAHRFLDYFFFAVETAATIGYGQLVPVTTTANVFMSIQALIGLMWLAVMTGLVFSKFSRPTARVKFSRHAVIANRPDGPALMFRMANERTDTLVEAQIHVILIRTEITADGEKMRRIYDLPLDISRNAFFSMSFRAVHRIDAASPLHGATAESLAEKHAAIAVTLVGLDEGLAATVHARHVYDHDDLVFGMNFADIFDPVDDDTWIMDMRHFDRLVDEHTAEEAPHAAQRKRSGSR
jgi:inward rectifier potassium channel